jgi:hypothetical protein
MRLFRPLSAALATTVIAAGAFTGPAAAQTAGVGTSLTSTKVLTAQLGDNAQLLDLLLLGDEARSTIDPAVAAPEAFSKLTALSVKTAIVPGNPINVTQGVAEARSNGANEVPIAATNFSVPALPAQLAPVLSGTVDGGKLTASLTNGVAASGLNTSLTDVKAVGGLISLGSLKSTLDSSASGATSSALRGASVNDLTVLDLGALLQGLGLPLGELTPAQLVALVDALAAQTGLPLPSGTDTLAAALAQLNAAIADLRATIATVPSSTSQITNAIDSTTATLLGTVGSLTGVTVPLPTTTQVVDDAIATVNALVGQLQALVNDLYAKGLQALDNLSLLKLEGVEVGVTTKAVDTVEGSVATVTGKVGKVLVGGVALPGIDLMSPLAAVNANVANINTKLGEVLSLVDPSLANVVKVSVLDKATSVVADGGYIRSRAGVTAASATITPPANLAAIVKTVTDQVGVAETLAASSVPVPAVSALMNDLAASLNLATSALTSPAKVSLASVLSASDFKVAGATGAPGSPAGSPSLPRTGSGLDLFLFGGLAAILALAIRRFGRSHQLQVVRIDK